MCEPVTATAAATAGATASAGITTAQILYAASLAITTASTAIGFVGQQQAAKAQEQFAVATAEQANAAFVDRSKVISRRTIEERDADSAVLTQNAVDAARAKGRARASAAEAGTSGLSVDALLADFSRQEGNFRNAILITQKNRETAAQDEIRGAGAQAQSRITAAQSNLPARPSFFGAALRIGEGAVTATDLLR